MNKQVSLKMIVEVVKYDPNWINLFKSESQNISQLLEGVIHRVHHIGSTAVPGLMAKPIIDILLEVEDLKELDQRQKDFENLGYEVMGEFGIPGRRYYRKGGENRTHQIHSFIKNEENVIRHIAFRDYLIHHPEIAMEYGQLKFRSAEKCNNDIGLYCDLKDDFIKHHEPLAVSWFIKNMH